MSVGIISDPTARERAEHALHELREALRDLAQAGYTIEVGVTSDRSAISSLRCSRVIEDRFDLAGDKTA